MRVLVTGASGFLGSHLLESLRAAGHEPVAAVRQSSDTTFIDAHGFEKRVVDFRAPHDDLVAALAGIDAVVHSAGGGKVTSLAEMEALNVAPTEKLWAAMAQQKTPRAVLVSSLAAVGPSQKGRPHDDDSAPRPASRYGLSKHKAEAVVRGYKDQVHTVIVRPPALFGPRDSRIVPVLEMARRGVVLDVGPRKMAICSGRDTADGIVALLDAPTTSGDAFFVEQGVSTSIPELARGFARAMGRRDPWAVPVPRPALWTLAATLEAVTCLVRGKSPFNRDKLRDAAPYVECNGQRLRDVAGWTPRDLETCFAETVAWHAQA